MDKEKGAVEYKCYQVKNWGLMDFMWVTWGRVHEDHRTKTPAGLRFFSDDVSKLHEGVSLNC